MQQHQNYPDPGRSASTSKRRRPACLQFLLTVLLLVLPLTAVYFPAAAQEDSWCAQTAGLDIPLEECLALEDLYNASGGPTTWLENAGWLDSAAVCGVWYGVACDEAGARVTEIILESNNLQGAIPASLAGLSALRVLDLSSNQLSGEIPPELGRLQQLQDLSLGANQLEGAIPPELGALATLQSFDLGGNRLSGEIPAELAQLNNLSLFFYLDGNQLEGAIPLAVCTMPNAFLSASIDFNKLAIYDAPHECDQRFENWYRTQIAPPSGFFVSGAASAPGVPSEAHASWDPIPFSAAAGGYELFTRDRFSGEVLSRGRTNDLSATEMTVTLNDDPDRYTYFLRSSAAPHAGNASALVSADSYELRLNSTDIRGEETAELQRLLYILALAIVAIIILTAVVHFIYRNKETNS